MKKIIIILSILSFSYSQEPNLVLKQLNIWNMHRIEKNISEIISLGNLNYTISSPSNPKKYDLSNPFIYHRNKSILPMPLYICHFYSKIDSIVRRSDYRWTTDKTIFKGLNLKQWKEEFQLPPYGIEYYATYYLNLKNKLIEEFGLPISLEDSLKNGMNDYVTIPSYNRECKWDVDTLTVTLHMHYGASAEISIEIEWDYERYSNVEDYGFRVFKQYEVDSRPIEGNIIQINVDSKTYNRYKNEIIVVTLLISKAGKVEKINFYKEIPELNKILEQKFKNFKFIPATKDNKKVRCLISLEIKLKETNK
jgi:hypothetical protein